MTSRLHVNVGLPVPLYPIRSWTRLPSSINLEDIWQLCGPQVERHLQALPLWKVFALVYFEGLAHGSGAERARNLPVAEEAWPPTQEHPS